MLLAVEAELTPCSAKSDRIVREIEEGEVLGVAAIAGMADGRTPDAGVLKSGAESGNIDGVTVGGVLIDEDDGLIGDKRAGEIVKAREVRAQDER